MKQFLICAWLFTIFSAAAAAVKLRVRLPAEVFVEAETLRLSDLLPDYAGAQLPAAAQAVSLGRAPQAGSVRVFTESQLRQAITRLPLGAADIDVAGPVVVRRRVWPLDAQTIRQALAASRFTHRLDLSQAKITLPPGFATVTPHPQVEVSVLLPSSDHLGFLARMRCRERAACQSFVVEIAWNATTGGIHSSEISLASRNSAPPALMSAAGPVLVEPGRLAWLVIENDGLKITQPMMPLRRARLGEVVRVRDPFSHRSLLAEVSGKGELRLANASRQGEAR